MNHHAFGGGGEESPFLQVRDVLVGAAIDLDDSLGLGEGDLVDDAIHGGAVGGGIDRLSDFPMGYRLSGNRKIHGHW